MREERHLISCSQYDLEHLAAGSGGFIPHNYGAGQDALGVTYMASFYHYPKINT